MVIVSAMSLRELFEVVPKAGKFSITEGAEPGSGFLVHFEVLK